MNNVKRPRIRFPEFTDDWEQRKFSEFTWNAGKRNLQNLDLEPYAVTNDRGFIKQSEAHDEFGYMKDVDRKAYNIVMPNSFAYNPARINVGSIGYYEGTENVIVSSLYEIFQTANYVDDRFLWHWLKADEFPKWIERLQEGSVRLYFYYDKLCECKMFMPSITEQKKISEYFDSLDNLITLHQRKLEQIKEYKKGMLQKMFPKEGEAVPEIRFPGFTDDWEQRKLGDIYSFQYGEFNNNPDNGGAYPIYGANGVIGGYTEYNAENSAVIGHMGAYAGYVVWAEGKHFVTYNGTIAKPSDDSTDSKYGFYLLCSKQIYRICAGSGQPFVSYNDLNNIDVVIPNTKQEQFKIGEYFTNLDNLITLHQRKCDKYKELKKGLLQQMFV
ncbi:MAG: restriction endonuclease subunit S [Lachnospiraceae bacterium]|nr:restriction endonuclease subunit S [Lachnospiraceae bacterium]